MKTVTRPLWDFLLVLSLLCGFVGLAYASDLYDRINDWLLEYEHWQLDEFFLSSTIAMPLLAWYAWRRQQEAVQETYLHRQSEMALREAHNALEQRVAARTQELNRMNFTLQAEVAARQRVQEQLSHDTLHDALTGLPNRVLFLDRLRHAIEFAKRNEGYHFATLFLDIDHFKVVNDSFGHEIGNQLLIGMAQRLRLGLRSGDTVARLSGDEFVILLEDTKDGLDATMTAHRIQAELKQPFSLSGYHIFASASIGIVQSLQLLDCLGRFVQRAPGPQMVWVLSPGLCRAPCGKFIERGWLCILQQEFDFVAIEFGFHFVRFLVRVHKVSVFVSLQKIRRCNRRSGFAS